MVQKTIARVLPEEVHVASALDIALESRPFDSRVLRSAIAHRLPSDMKHNSYFDGRVQSIGFERNGLKATVGMIEPGEYHFNTAAAERMTVTTGMLRAKLANSEWQSFPAGTYFEVPANSGFDVQAVGGPAGYLCEFLG